MAFGKTWLKPEIDEFKYYVHLAIIIGVIYGLMNLYNPMSNLFVWGLYLLAGDIVAHTVLKMD